MRQDCPGFFSFDYIANRNGADAVFKWWRAHDAGRSAGGFAGSSMWQICTPDQDARRLVREAIGFDRAGTAAGL